MKYKDLLALRRQDQAGRDDQAGATIIPLIDGALYYDPRTRRRQLVEQMAADLAASEAYVCEQDAFRSLIFCQKYQAHEVALLFRDAIAEAQQIVVAGEMSAS